MRFCNGIFIMLKFIKNVSRVAITHLLIHLFSNAKLWKIVSVKCKEVILLYKDFISIKTGI